MSMQRVRVHIDDGIVLDCLAATDLELACNDWAVVRSRRWEDCGRVVAVDDGPADANADLPNVYRRADLIDQGKISQNRQRARQLGEIGREAIQRLDLPMRLVNTHLTYDSMLAIFVFTAPGRVDFRQLLRDLSAATGLRVELRQIGPRDQAAATGGLSVCGRPLCCTSFLSGFASINVKMAKAQGVALNPGNIIGSCGRLKCCLEFEYEPRSGRRGQRAPGGDDDGERSPPDRQATGEGE